MTKNKGYKEDLCNNIVYYKKSSSNDSMTIFVSETAHGYHNKASSFSKYYFCSKECMDYFNKCHRCHRCNQDCK